MEPATRVLTVIGLMSGTSLDGVDAAVIETDGERIASLGPRITRSYGSTLRDRLRALLDRAHAINPRDPELRAVERAVTQAYAEAVNALGVRAGLIGMHGQTILHRPREAGTWQIGDAGLLATLTGVPVVHDFRSDDIRAGGEGAPLAPLFHAAMLPASQDRPVAILNLGGVANLTWVGPDADLLACDTGPGNALLDDWAQRHTGVACDHDGALARAGTSDDRVLDALLADPYFVRLPPKSLDRLHFAPRLSVLSALSAQDGAATLSEFTAAAVAATRLPATPRAWFVCGGGRHNPALMAALATRLAAPVRPVEAIGWDGDALEAQCFGFLAARSLRGLPLSLPGTTGAAAPVTGGRLATPAA